MEMGITDLVVVRQESVARAKGTWRFGTACAKVEMMIKQQ